jgi:hypothetical protein
MGSEESGVSSVSQTILSGAAAGLFSDAIVHPISTLKARLQVSTSAASQSLVSNVRSIVNVEGWRVLYTGMTVYALSAPARALYFGGYEAVRAFRTPQNKAFLDFACGPVAQFSGSLLWVPMDVVKECMQVQTTNSSSASSASCASRTQLNNPVQAIRHIVETRGARGLYRGFLLHQLLWGPFNFIFFPSYELIKQSGLYDQSAKRSAHPLAAVLAAGFAGGVTAPIDTIKVRLQTQPRYMGAWHCATSTVREEGAAALFKGGAARVLWIAPNMCLTMSLYSLLSSQWTSQA